METSKQVYMYINCSNINYSFEQNIVCKVRFGLLPELMLAINFLYCTMHNFNHNTLFTICV